jgi:phenylalanine-4-hydroxylase
MSEAMKDKKNQSHYIAKPVDANGVVHYTDDENAVWQTLMQRQRPILQNRACDEFIHGLTCLSLPESVIPQCKDVSAVLQDLTGWSLEPVAALISFDKFFNLLANRKFPAATFIRTREELDYLKEPDIFHEIFGHCPLLTNPAYAEFVHTYGKLGVNATPQERVLLARLFWFTIEFGLMKTEAGLRAYGGGILSSMKETVYCVESDEAVRHPFDVMHALRMPYDIDVIQPTYFVLDRFDQLFDLTKLDILALVRQAQREGERQPLHAC